MAVLWFAPCALIFLWLSLFVVDASDVQPAQDPPLNISTWSPSQIRSNVYTIWEETRDIGEPFTWLDVNVDVKDKRAHKALLQTQVPQPGTVNSSFFVPLPVYISLTTMASRMHKVNRTIISLIQARVVPTRIYLFISKEPFLLDQGVTHISDELLCLVAAGYLQIVYTQNLGPHRKLLPALRRHWTDDVFIATVDDDMRRDQGYVILYQLLKHYVMGGEGDRVVALRTRRIAMCNSLPYRITKYYSWPVQLAYNRQEMLIMPTGTGGILYKPSYFHKVIFHKSLRFATGTADDLMFRLATMVKRIPVQLGCSVMRHRGQVVRECPEDEYDRKYDAMYGPSSTKFFKELTASITAQMQADIAAARAAAAAAAKNRTENTVLAHADKEPNHEENEHDNEGVAEAAAPEHRQLRGAESRTENGCSKEVSRSGNHATTDVAARRSSWSSWSSWWQHQPTQQTQITQGDKREGMRAEDWEDSDLQDEDGSSDGPLSAPLDPHLFPIPDIWSDLEQEESPYDAAEEWGDHNSEGEPDSEQHRRLARKIRYRTMAHNGTEKDLFSINRKGGNDLAWKLAVEVLNVMRVMDIEEITTEFVGERERFCYARRRSVNMERYCALYDCDKPTEALFPGLQNVSVRAIRGRGKSKGVVTVAKVPADSTMKGGVGEQKQEEED